MKRRDGSTRAHVDRERDLALLHRYWEGLRAASVEATAGSAVSQWDYRFSLITNLFQAVFQGSAFWFRKTAGLVREVIPRGLLVRATCLAVMKLGAGHATPW